MATAHRGRRRRWLRAAWLAAAAPAWLAAAGLDDDDDDEARDAARALDRVELPWARGEAAPGPADANLATPCPPSPLRSRLIGLPVYGTLPNEGSTFGAIPILLRVCRGDGSTRAIYAPSLSWNRALGVTGTMRWFAFFPEDRSVTVTGSWSQHTNRGALVAWAATPRGVGRPNLEASLEAQQSIFFRLFGLGPDSRREEESNQARRRARLSVRAAVNLPRALSAGLTVRATYDKSLPAHIAGLVASRARFPEVRGVTGESGGVAVLADVRLDSRAERDYARTGFLAEVQGGALVGVAGVPTHLRLRAEVRGLWAARPWLTGAARARVAYVDRSDVPFYYLSPLGGGTLGRGFIEDRFLDQGAWLVEHELRLRVATTSILGVNVDWRVDPFVLAGQVFSGLSEAVRRPRLAAGVGLRAWLKPNVVGRIDVAYGGEGIAPYVELGYPF